MYLLFPAKGGSNRTTAENFPFKILLETVQSGIPPQSFDAKCPCDTGNYTYTSKHFFSPNTSYPTILNSGSLAFKIYSGSTLYSQFKMNSDNGAKVTSYQGNSNETVIDGGCQNVFQKSAMTVFGLNRSVFIQDFFGPNPPPDSTLKIWLTVCFPMGDFDLSKTAVQQYETVDPNNLTCQECDQRANVPMAAFVSCQTGDWPALVQADLINKATGSPFPRLEKRQILARVPIGEINVSGQLVAQYLDSNLTLQDVCLQGIPCKYPLSIFSEYR
jgi:hypothetical protein